MSFLSRFLGKRKDKRSQGANLAAELEAMLESVRRPAIHMLKTESSAFSRLGGLPLVPPNFIWPRYKDLPLAFLCQIDLAQIPNLGGAHQLPASGFLSVFYDQEQSTWGFDPADKGSWRVFYFEEDRSALAPAAAPIGLADERI